MHFHDSLNISMPDIWCKCKILIGCVGHRLFRVVHHNSRVVQMDEVTQDDVNLPLVTSTVETSVQPQAIRQ
jgi:hypothetical protein